RNHRRRDGTGIAVNTGRGNMEVFLRKHFWVFNAAVIAAAAGFLARATEHLLEAQVLPPTADRPAAVARKPPAPVQAPHSKDETDILNRNVFCSTCPPILAKATQEQPADTGPTKTTMPIRLVLTAISPKDAKWSIAVLCDTQNKQCGAFGLGS